MDVSQQPTHKLITAINKNVEPGVALNAAAHMALGLSARIMQEFPAMADDLMFLNFRDRDGEDHAFISGLSLIVLRATVNELRKLRQGLQLTGVPFVDFTATMTGDTYVEQLARTAQTPTAALDYFGVCAFGLRDQIDPLTRKLSLWR